MKTELQRARAFTDSLFGIVGRETLYERPIPARHRLIFYVGHLDAFDWNQLARGILGKPSFDASFDALFEAGIDPPPGQAPQDTPADWPVLEAVQTYVARTRSAIDEIWDRVPTDMQQMVIEHSLDACGNNLLSAAPTRSAVEAAGAFCHAQWVRFYRSSHAFHCDRSGCDELGQPNGEFGWDNEFPAHVQAVPAFEIGKHKVTNGEYLRFVEQGGVAPPFLALERRCVASASHVDEVPLPLDTPVYATHEQAQSFAQWAGAGLPTEAEWHRAAYRDDDQAYPWGNTAPNGVHGNFDLLIGIRIGEFKSCRRQPLWRSQMIGNGWEWTSTPFKGFKGFEASSYYPGYSANFFDDEHYVLKGGSPVTSRNLLRRSFRNWFRATIRTCIRRSDWCAADSAP